MMLGKKVVSTGHGDETLRWPPRLDRQGILARLIAVRRAAQEAGLQELATLFAAIETMNPARMGVAVVHALDRLQDRPEHRALAAELEIVALNLKHLR
jgi:hypothetical protein